MVIFDHVYKIMCIIMHYISILFHMLHYVSLCIIMLQICLQLFTIESDWKLPTWLYKQKNNTTVTRTKIKWREMIWKKKDWTTLRSSSRTLAPIFGTLLVAYCTSMLRNDRRRTAWGAWRGGGSIAAPLHSYLHGLKHELPRICLFCNGPTLFTI